MTDKINLFELDINVDALTDNTAKAVQKINELQDSQKDLKKNTSDLQKEIKSYSDLMKEAQKNNDTKTYDELKAAQEQLKEKYVDNTKELVVNQKELKNARKEYNMGIKIMDAYTEKNAQNLQIITQTDGSIDQLSAALSNNKALYKTLSKEQRENTEIGGRLRQVIQEQDAEYKKLHTQIGNTNVNVGNYKESIREAFEEGDYFNRGLQDLIGKIPIVGSSLSTATANVQKYVAGQRAGAAATEGTSRSLKLFKIALISTGIGAIVVALGSLVAGFMSTQRGIDAVNRVLKPLQVIFQRLWGEIQSLSTAMVDAFSDPQKVISDLWEVLKSQIVNRIKGVADTFKYLGRTIEAAFKMDFEGMKDNASQMGESVVQTITGVDELNKKVQNAAKKTNQFLRESIKTGKGMADLEREIEEVENGMVITRARLRTEYEKQLEVAQDVSRTETERKEAAQEAIRIQDELLASEQLLLDMKIRLKEEQNALNDTSRADEKELNELIAQRTTLEADAATKRASARNLEMTINKEIEANKIQAVKQETEQALKESETRLKLFIAENEGRARTLQEHLTYEEQAYKGQLKLFKEQLEAGKITQSEYDLALIQSKKDFLEKQSNLTIEHAEKELDLYIAQNKSKIESETVLTDSILAEEQRRLQTIYEKELQFLDMLGLSEEEYQLRKIELQAQYLEKDKELKETYKLQQQEQSQREFEMDYELKAVRGELMMQLELDRMDRQHAMERERAIAQGTWTVKQEQLYAEKRKQIEKAVQTEKQALYSDAMGNIASIMGEQTAVGKAAAVAQATIDTYMAANAAYSSLAGIPVIGPALGIAAAAAAIASGVRNVKKIVSTKTDMPKAEQGAVIDIGGKRHSAGGTKFYGEDGTAFEAERGEKMFILNRMASKAYAPYLSRLNQMYGGVPLSQSSSYLAAGGAVARVGGAGVKGSTFTIDYDLLANKVAQRMGDRFGEEISKLPNPVTDVKDIISEVSKYNKVVNGASF